MRELPFQMKFVLGSAKTASVRKTRTRPHPAKLPTSLSEMKQLVRLDDDNNGDDSES
jgi:hypothetical protein